MREEKLLSVNGLIFGTPPQKCNLYCHSFKITYIFIPTHKQTDTVLVPTVGLLHISIYFLPK